MGRVRLTSHGVALLLFFAGVGLGVAGVWVLAGAGWALILAGVALAAAGLVLVDVPAKRQDDRSAGR